MSVERSNTILYSDRWPEMVRFYRDVLRFPVAFQNDWFVEFAVGSAAFVSIADAARSSIAPGDGTGITLSWLVADLAGTRSALIDAGAVASDIATRWGSLVFDVFDPAGNRIEFWSHATPS